MPIERSGIIAPWERAICQRAARLRGLQGWSQDECAAALGATRDQIANIESCRTPLRFELGWTLCKKANISQLWLLDECEPIRPFLEVDLSPSQADSWRYMSFHRVCQGPLRDALVAQRQVAIGQAAAGQGAAASLESALSAVAVALRGLPEARRAEAASELVKAVEVAGSSEPDSKLTVDTAESTDSLPAVIDTIPSWIQLRKEAELLTGAPGAKAQLARDLGTTRQAVNKWLNQQGAPSADVTLKLLAWVHAAKAKAQSNQQKSAASAITPAAPNTQPRKGPRDETKRKPSRKKT